jgi:hypothetical protein
MSDFLTSLAVRTLGVASTLQPRITPMFAPQPTPVKTFVGGESQAPLGAENIPQEAPPTDQAISPTDVLPPDPLVPPARRQVPLWSLGQLLRRPIISAVEAGGLDARTQALSAPDLSATAPEANTAEPFPPEPSLPQPAREAAVEHSPQTDASLTANVPINNPNEVAAGNVSAKTADDLAAAPVLSSPIPNPDPDRASPPTRHGETATSATPSTPPPAWGASAAPESSREHPPAPLVPPEQQPVPVQPTPKAEESRTLEASPALNNAMPEMTTPGNAVELFPAANPPGQSGDAVTVGDQSSATAQPFPSTPGSAAEPPSLASPPSPQQAEVGTPPELAQRSEHLVNAEPLHQTVETGREKGDTPPSAALAPNTPNTAAISPQPEEAALAVIAPRSLQPRQTGTSVTDTASSDASRPDAASPDFAAVDAAIAPPPQSLPPDGRSGASALPSPASEFDPGEPFRTQPAPLKPRSLESTVALPAAADFPAVATASAQHSGIAPPAMTSISMSPPATPVITSTLWPSTLPAVNPTESPIAELSAAPIDEQLPSPIPQQAESATRVSLVETDRPTFSSTLAESRSTFPPFTPLNAPTSSPNSQAAVPSSPLSSPTVTHHNQAHIRALLIRDVPVAEPAPAVVAETPPKASIGAAERPTVPTSVPAPPPPIEVTIGRIDVRVTPPEPPAKRPRRSVQGPAVSLQDYLNSRNRS